MTPSKPPAGLNSFGMYLAARCLSQDSELFQVVVEMLRIGWSPQQIARRLRGIWPGQPERYVSHETIYLAIYSYPGGELKRQPTSYLRQGDGKPPKRTQSNVRIRASNACPDYTRQAANRGVKTLRGRLR